MSDDTNPLREALSSVRQSVKNARGAIESNQVVDKDVHGTLTRAIAAIDAALSAPPPLSNVVGIWLPIAQADRTINHVTEFTQIGLTLKNSDTFWVRDEDGRVYRAAWSEGNKGRDYWWDWEGESPVDPVEFMPHPLDLRFHPDAKLEDQP